MIRLLAITFAVLWTAPAFAMTQEIGVFHLPDGNDDRLELLSGGKLYSYKDPSGELATWVLGFELTRPVRRQNWLSQDSAPRRGATKIDVSSTIGVDFCRVAKRQSWFVSCAVTYDDFFNSVEPELQKIFARLDASSIEIVENRHRTFKERLSQGSHPIADLARSLDFIWIPHAGTRTEVVLKAK